jgi:glycerophosphoryl diester phosphodiesterase
MSRTRIVCHRGACRVAPENTIASGLKARELGGDIVELDLRQSRDGVLYVLHDSTVDRTTNGSGAIAEMESAELDRLDAGDWFGSAFTGEPLPRFDRFLKELKAGLDFYVEVKSANADAVAAAIKSAGLAERCFTYSEQAGTRAAMREAAPWLKRMINWSNLIAISEARTVHDAQILEFHATDFTLERLAEVRDAGLEIMIHTPFADKAMFRLALEAGVEYLNIDFPEIVAPLREQIQ